MAETFQEFIKGERMRLSSERRALVKQQDDIAKQLIFVDRELAAIAAYETTKTGKTVAPAKPAVPATPKPRIARKVAPTRSRRDSKREPILKLIGENPTGLTRGEILERMGLKGNRSGEMSVSNALTALSKSSKVARQDGKYIPASA